VAPESQNPKVLLSVLPQEKGKFCTQSDAVLSRCTSIVSKANYAVPPIGLAYMAAMIRQHSDAQVILWDAVAQKRSPHDFISAVTSQQPDVLIATIGTSTYPFNAYILKKIRDRLSDTTIVGIGPHVTALPDEALQDGTVDYVIRGEPEYTILELISKNSLNDKVGDVAGISYRLNGNVYHNPPRPLIDDLDGLPFPAWDILDASYAPPFSRKSPFGLIITSRGCPYNCHYCASKVNYGSRWRARSVGNIIREIEHMIHQGFKNFGFWDDTFTINRKRVIHLCREIVSRKLNIQWICLSRGDTVDPEMLSWMANAGCYQIQYGVETGIQAHLDSLGKGITLDKIRQAFAWSRKAGIETSAFFMLGHWEETRETLEQTWRFALDLDPDYVSFNILTPYPGTPLYERVSERFKNRWEYFDATHAVLDPIISADELERFLKKCYRRFYFRPAYFSRSIRKIQGPRHFWQQIQAGANVLLNTLKG
jgi:radical SAM superfamily enzyme YgiQ (UPF0313 family)